MQAQLGITIVIKYIPLRKTTVKIELSLMGHELNVNAEIGIKLSEVYVDFSGNK